MAVIIDGSSISGISSGGLNDTCISPYEFGYPGAVVQTVTTSTRTQASYAVVIIPATLGTTQSNPGTEITLMNMTITPLKAGNKIVMKWTLSGETTDHNMNFSITRNGTVIAGGNAIMGRYYGLGTNQYDGDYLSTPVVDNLLFVDESSLSVASTYKVHVRASGASAGTYWLNRAVNAPSDDDETGISVGVLYEVNT